jgi:DNA-binding response OmpR family regulator
MEDLKLYNLLLVGEREERDYFQKYFQKIYRIKNPIYAFNFYLVHKPSIIFFSSNRKVFNPLSIIEQIREYDRETIIVILSEQGEEDILLESLSLHLSGYLEKPFNNEKVEEVLSNITHDLNLLYANRIKLKENYIFNYKKNILYDREYKEIKLTKNELKLMSLMSKSKEKYISLEQIEHTIWEEASLVENCQARLKALLHGLRKKLPEKSILNSYNLGYKLAGL